MPADDAIMEKLALTLEHLEDAEVLMQNGVSAEAWPTVGKLLSDLQSTMKKIELDMIGHWS